MAFVYLAVFADGTSYVGQTINDFEQLEARYKAYTKKNIRAQPSRQACFALGMPALGVIEYCPPEKLNEREKYWIRVHRQDGKHLNVADGGGNYQKRPLCRITTEVAKLRQAKDKLSDRQADKLARMESKLAKAAKRMAK